MRTLREPVGRQRCVRTGGGAVLLLATATLAGCAVDVPDEDLSTLQAPLFLDGAPWPTNDAGVHVVPVCFDAVAVQHPDYPSLRDVMHRAVNQTWGAVANIVFTEFAPCTVASGHVEVTFWDLPGGQTEGTGAPPPWASRKLRINPGEVNQGLVAHEFGHALGFRHEFDRPDFIDDSSGTCREPNKFGGGNTLGTAANDRASIMTYSYCSESPGELSPWDIVGVQAAYGRKRAGEVVGKDNRCLNVASIEDQVVPTIFDCNGGINQRWTHGTDDSLSINYAWVTKCLDVPAANNADGTSPTLYGCHGGTNQKWALKNVSIRGLGGKCLERKDSQLTNGTPVQLGTCNFRDWNQTWTFTSAGEIRSGDGGPESRCIDVQGGSATNGTPLTLYDCHGGTNQKFTMSGGQLRVLGKCMDVERGDPTDGTAVSLYTCGGSTKLNQQWNTMGQLVTLGKCLQLPAGTTNNGDLPTLASCASQASPNQRWDYYW